MSIPKVKLSNGIEMPIEGFGVWKVPDTEEGEDIIVQALKTGYRMIDTAAVYRNERRVGNAIKKSGIPRNEIFITTKVFPNEYGYENIKKAFARSLKFLQTDYIDLYLIHQPYGNYYDSWRAFEELYKEGKIKAIGVSNFYPDRLTDFCESPLVTIKPMVNQMELHPFRQRELERKTCKEYGIAIEAWGSLMQLKEQFLGNDIIKSIAEKHKKSFYQICLKWAVQNEIIIIPKSANKDRMMENMQLFDWNLDDEDMEKIKKLDGTVPPIENHYDPNHCKFIYKLGQEAVDYINALPEAK